MDVVIEALMLYINPSATIIRLHTIDMKCEI